MGIRSYLYSSDEIVADSPTLAKKTCLNSCAGQSLIETCVALIVVSCLMGGIMKLTFLGFAKLWLNIEIFRAVVCLAQGETSIQCQRQFRDNLASVVPFYEKSSLSLSKSSFFNSSLLYPKSDRIYRGSGSLSLRSGGPLRGTYVLELPRDI